MIDIGERAGSGIFNLVTVWKQMGWDKPILTNNFENERTRLMIPIEMEEDEKINGGLNAESGGLNAESGGLNPENGGLNPENGGLNAENEELNLLLETIIQYSGKQTQFFEKKLNKPKRTIERWLKKLRDNEEIEFRGSKKTGGYWKITKE
ncbi:MAG: hypothetical protein LBT50_03640 [Prevotellaceae bacterium]|nr:hypothetical protein [Prevotellaceae bacterium]